ncbi:MAG: non-hydrolyzing UDP-N-acetylglucosamine 2-epimerase [Syntrophobacteraceae bacterium]
MARFVTIVGTRPQFIKAASISLKLKGMDGVEEIVVNTGQHYDKEMSEIFFEQLELPPFKHHLGVGSGSHGAQTARMLAAIEEVLRQENPDCTIVYGDTNSTLAAALAAAKLNIPLAHIEAGLRSFNRQMPEEINRILTDHAADRLFAPTRKAAENLIREGIARDRIFLVGDVMFDVAIRYGAKAQSESKILSRLGLEPKNYILATVHRAENCDDLSRLGAIFDGLKRTASSMPVILPLHPRTRNALARAGLECKSGKNFHITAPAGYLDMTMLEKNAAVIATDSGGVQKEAFFHRVPCITLREETEWVELVELGWNQVVKPVDGKAICEAITSRLGRGGQNGSPYGDGNTAEKIIAILLGGHPS